MTGACSPPLPRAALANLAKSICGVRQKRGCRNGSGGQLLSHWDSQLVSGPSQMASTGRQQMLPGRRLLGLRTETSFRNHLLGGYGRSAPGGWCWGQTLELLTLGKRARALWRQLSPPQVQECIGSPSSLSGQQKASQLEGDEGKPRRRKTRGHCSRPNNLHSLGLGRTRRQRPTETIVGFP